MDISPSISALTNDPCAPTVIALVRLLAIVTLMATTDKFGRRKIVFSCAAFCTLMLMIVGILGEVEKTGPLKNFLIVVAVFWSMR